MKKNKKSKSSNIIVDIVLVLIAISIINAIPPFLVVSIFILFILFCIGKYSTHNKTKKQNSIPVSESVNNPIQIMQDGVETKFKDSTYKEKSTRLFDIFHISKIKAENEILKSYLSELGCDGYEQVKEKFQQIESAYSEVKQENEALKTRISELGCDEYEQVKEKIKQLEANHSQNIENAQNKLDATNEDIAENNSIIAKLREEKSTLSSNNEKLQKQIETQTRKLQRLKELYKSVDYCITNFLDNGEAAPLSSIYDNEYDEFAPSIILKLHNMDMKDLRKAYRDNDKAIDQILTSYAKRYTTKANRSIYQLMVIALRAELQNILYNLKYQKLEEAIDDVKTVTAKYLQIAGEGNQSISGTLTKFIGEIEYLFINAVKIEYNYYVKKEQAKQEQLAIKQQMREEAEERKLLEQQRKKIETEESKYHIEIAKVNEAISSATDTEEVESLKAKILELQGLLSDVTIKKDEISKLQNGKAGNVYIISNLGSFGDNIFKVGMTRRINPQDRIDELSNASVPFRYDVHSFIFSDDAVGLENKLHTILNDKRVNKVNMRKEFFYATLDELESLVNELDPTAEFKKTMIAEEFYQSQSTDVPYTSEHSEEFDEEDEENKVVNQ